MKMCNKCKEEFPMTKEFFYSDKSKKDGLTTFCKPCKNVSIETYKQKNLDKYLAYQKEYHSKEENKQRKLINDAEYRKKHKAKMRKYNQNYYKINKEAIKQQVRKYAEENIEVIRERKRMYYRTPTGMQNAKTSKNRRRLKMKKLPINFTLDQWNECLSYFDKKCAYCGCKEKLEQEHFIPVDKGGEYSKNNIIPSCLPCNRNKRNHNFFVWYPSFAHYSKEREKKILGYLGYSDTLNQQLSIL